MGMVMLKPFWSACEGNELIPMPKVLLERILSYVVPKRVLNYNPKP